MNKIKLLIVDDHRVLVNGLVALFHKSNTVQVIATAHNASECRHFLRSEIPHVVLLDINLPDASGIDLCREIKSNHPSVKIVALSSFNEYAVVRQMLENGASGYVVKNAMPEEIIQSVEMAMEEDAVPFLCNEIDRLMHRRAHNAVWLTPREKQLLQLITEGFTNAEIAEKLFLGVETVNSYRKNLLVKLGAKNTAMLVRIALQEKWV